MPPDVGSAVGASPVIWNWSVPGYCGVPPPGAVVGVDVRAGVDVGPAVGCAVGWTVGWTDGRAVGLLSPGSPEPPEPPALPEPPEPLPAAGFPSRGGVTPPVGADVGAEPSDGADDGADDADGAAEPAGVGVGALDGLAAGALVGAALPSLFEPPSADGSEIWNTAAVARPIGAPFAMICAVIAYTPTGNVRPGSYV